MNTTRPHGSARLRIVPPIVYCKRCGTRRATEGLAPTYCLPCLWYCSDPVNLMDPATYPPDAPHRSTS